MKIDWKKIREDLGNWERKTEGVTWRLFCKKLQRLVNAQLNQKCVWKQNINKMVGFGYDTGCGHRGKIARIYCPYCGRKILGAQFVSQAINFGVVKSCAMEETK